MKFARDFLFLAAGFILAQVVVISMDVAGLKETSKEIRAEIDGLKTTLQAIQQRTKEANDRIDALTKVNP